jgi:hypothetical protein
MSEMPAVAIAPGACYSCEYSDRCPGAYLFQGPCTLYEEHRPEDEEEEANDGLGGHPVRDGITYDPEVEDD